MTVPPGAEIHSRFGVEINSKFLSEYSFSSGKVHAHILDLKMDLEPLILVVVMSRQLTKTISMLSIII